MPQAVACSGLIRRLGEEVAPKLAEYRLPVLLPACLVHVAPAGRQLLLQLGQLLLVVAALRQLLLSAGGKLHGRFGLPGRQEVASQGRQFLVPHSWRACCKRAAGLNSSVARSG